MRSLSRSPQGDRRNQEYKNNDEALDIEAVLLHYGFDSIPARESWTKVRCAFHGERQASATVSRELGAFKCFACEFTGDVLKIIQLAEKREGRPSDFLAACRVYENIVGRPVTGVRQAASGESGGAVATEPVDFERGDGVLRNRLRGNSNERRQRPSR